MKEPQTQSSKYICSILIKTASAQQYSKDDNNNKKQQRQYHTHFVCQIKTIELHRFSFESTVMRARIHS